MTALTLYRPWTSPTIRHASVVRQLVIWADLINAAAAVLRPLLVTAGVIAAAATSSAPAHADPLSESITNALNTAASCYPAPPVGFGDDRGSPPRVHATDHGWTGTNGPRPYPG